MTPTAFKILRSIFVADASMCRQYLGACVLAFLTGAAGCAVEQQQRAIRFYGGDALPADKVATIWWMNDSRIVVRSIGGHSFDGYCDKTMAIVCVVEIQPGRHTMSAAYNEERKVGGKLVLILSPSKTVNFDVEAGKFYSISASRLQSVPTPPGVETGKGLLVDLAVNAINDAVVATPTGIGDEDWSVRIEPSGDPNKPVEE